MQIIDPKNQVQAIPFLPIVTPEQLRDFFAAFALSGMLGRFGEIEKDRQLEMAETAFDYADAMLKARRKTD